MKKRGSCGLESQNGETDRSRFDLWFFLLGQHCLDGAPAKEETEQQRHADGGLMADGAVFIASGIIDTRKDEVIAGLEQVGLAVVEVKEKRGWECIVCKKA